MSRVLIRNVSRGLSLSLFVGMTLHAQVAPATYTPPPMPRILSQYRSVTADALKNPPANDWLMIRRTYDGWGYSPLEQITTANAKNLKPVWV